MVALVLAEEKRLTQLIGDNNLRKAFNSLSLMVENKRRLPEAQVQKRLKVWGI